MVFFYSFIFISYYLRVKVAREPWLPERVSRVLQHTALMARAPRHLSSPPSPTVPSSRIPSTAHQATRLLSLLLLRQPPLSLSPPSTSRGTLSLPLSLPSSLLVLVLYLYLFLFTKRFVHPFSAYYSITFLSLLAERVVALFFRSALFSLILFIIISVFFQLLYY